jgi:nucleotidyltransferase substrate binding protein (TIGR01987 family)
VPTHAKTCSEDLLESFDNGLRLLHRALSRGPEALNPLEKEGAIRRFEYCLELAWKVAKEYLEYSGLRIAPVTPREVIRQAAAAGVLADGQVWIQMLDHRTLLAYTCDGVVQAEVIDALVARYFPAMEGLREFLAAQGRT